MNDNERDMLLLDLKKLSQDNTNDLTQIKTVLKGYNGKTGLCEQVEKDSSNIKKLTIALVILSVSAGGGAYGIIQVVLKTLNG